MCATGSRLKGLKSIYQANKTQKPAGITKFISDNIDCKSKLEEIKKVTIKVTY